MVMSCLLESLALGFAPETNSSVTLSEVSEVLSWFPYRMNKPFNKEHVLVVSGTFYNFA